MIDNIMMQRETKGGEADIDICGDPGRGCFVHWIGCE